MNLRYPIRLNSKGRTIGEQVAHMHNNRIAWMDFVYKGIYNKSLLIDKNTFLTRSFLSTAFAASSNKIVEVINMGWEKEGNLPSFKTGLIQFIIYLVSHESHHRGSILLTLKQSGIKLPDNLKWGLWEWGK
jgi:uncharacterized damage-inducible protein DinB